PGYDPEYAEFLVFLHVTKGRMGRANDETVSIPTAKVLRWLWHRCADENEWYQASKKRVAIELQMIHTTVSRCIQRLEKWGFVEQRRQKFTECRLLRSVVEPELIKAVGFQSPSFGMIDETGELPKIERCAEIDIGFLADMTGSAKAALFLSQAIYWQRRMSGKNDGWWYKTREDWTRKTGLTRREQETARKKLRKVGILQEERRGMPARVWYRVNDEALGRLAGQRKIGAIEDRGRVWH
ncbi:MAG: hypothetical protein L0Y43_05830, partial [Methylococcaceae bacterium]|nr:hypothetical protein [Methylococcaceae bacterium]